MCVWKQVSQKTTVNATKKILRTKTQPRTFPQGPGPGLECQGQGQGLELRGPGPGL